MGKGCQPLNLSQKPIIWQDFCRKLHINERNWTEGGGACLAPHWIRQCLLLVNQESYTSNYFVFDWFHNSGKLGHMIRRLIVRYVIHTGHSFTDLSSSNNKKALQLNTNRPLADSPLYIVNEIKHVRRGAVPVQRGPS